MPFLLSLIVAAIMLFVPSALLRTLLGLRCLMRRQSYTMTDDGGEDYYQAQYLWSKDMKYHKDHFLYKCLSEALNPEFLSPGTDVTLKIDDLKGSYGDATARAADSAGTQDTYALKGGR